MIDDPVGGPYTEPALLFIAWKGRFLVVGFAAGDIPKLPLNLVLPEAVTYGRSGARSSSAIPRVTAPTPNNYWLGAWRENCRRTYMLFIRSPKRRVHSRQLPHGR